MPKKFDLDNIPDDDIRRELHLMLERKRQELHQTMRETKAELSKKLADSGRLEGDLGKQVTGKFAEAARHIDAVHRKFADFIDRR